MSEQARTVVLQIGDAEIDIAAVPAIRAELRSVIETHSGAVIVVDLGSVRFIDSTGLGALVGALKSARLAGGDMRVINLHDNILRVFEITGLAELFALS